MKGKYTCAPLTDLELAELLRRRCAQTRFVLLEREVGPCEMCTDCEAAAAISRLVAENARLLEGTVKAVLNAVPGRQDKDHIARCLQDKYGPWWHDKSQIRHDALNEV